MADNTEYKLLVTKKGLEKLARATDQEPVQIEKYALGDGGGNAITPKEDMTSLVNEIYRDYVKSIEKLDNAVTITCVLDSNAKIKESFYIRELGLFDKEGDLIAICSVPESYKPKEDAGVGTELIISVVLEFENTEKITINIPESLFATVADVDKLKLELDDKYYIKGDELKITTKSENVTNNFYTLDLTQNGEVKIERIASPNYRLHVILTPEKLEFSHTNTTGTKTSSINNVEGNLSISAGNYTLDLAEGTLTDTQNKTYASLTDNGIITKRMLKDMESSSVGNLPDLVIALLKSKIGIEQWFNINNVYKDQKIVKIGIYTWALMQEGHFLSVSDYPIAFKNCGATQKDDGTFQVPFYYNGTIRHIVDDSARELGTFQKDAFAAHEHPNVHNHPDEHQHEISQASIIAGNGTAGSSSYYLAQRLGIIETTTFEGQTGAFEGTTQTAGTSEETVMKNTSGQFYLLVDIDTSSYNLTLKDD